MSAHGRWMALALACAACSLGAADTFRVATFNLNYYGDQTLGTRLAKSPEARAKVRESIRALGAEIMALQEVGGERPFLELIQSLKAEGVDYRYGELLQGADTNIQVALLSKFPITACHRHTNDTYLLMGRRFPVQRGVLEAEVQVNSNYTFTAFVVHLKSRRQTAEADELEMRLQEALILREKIDAVLKRNPRANVVVLGDLNDVKDSRPVRAVLGRYQNVLLDARPAERNGDTEPSPNPRWDAPWITWTYFYGKEDEYSRIDYILFSPGMASEWVREGTYVLALPNWGVASDHRPIVAAFTAQDK